MEYHSLISQKISNPNGKTDYVQKDKREFTATRAQVDCYSTICALYPPPDHGNFYVYPVSFAKLIDEHAAAQQAFEKQVFEEILQSCRNARTVPSNSWSLTRIHGEIYTALRKRPDLLDADNLEIVTLRLRASLQKELVPPAKLLLKKK